MTLWLRNGVGVAREEWKDSSSQNNHATQGTSGNQAVVSGGGLEFVSGEADHYDLAGDITCSAAEGFMVFIVIEPDAVDARTILGIGGVAEFLEIMTNKKIRIKIDDSAVTWTHESIQFPVDEKFVLGIQREAGETGAINIYKDGTLLTPTSGVANPGEIVFNTIGNRNDDRYFDGHLYEMLVYEGGDLSTSEIGKVNNYLINKHTPLG